MGGDLHPPLCGGQAQVGGIPWVLITPPGGGGVDRDVGGEETTPARCDWRE